MTPAARRPRSPILSVVLAVSGLGLAGPASAVAIYPDGFDDASLSQWLGQETDLRPAQVVAISRGSVAGIIAGPEMRDGVAWVTVRLEATAPPAPLPNDVEILSSQVEVAVDCDHRLIRQGASTGHPGRNLAGTGYIIAEQDGDWKFPTVGTQLDAVWRAVCDPGFVRPLTPRPVRAAVRPHPAGRQTQLAQAGRAKPPAPANAKPAPTPAKPPAPAAAKPPAPPPAGPIETTAAPPAPPATTVAPPPAPLAAKPLDLAAAPPPAAEPVPEPATVEAPPPAPAADKPVEPAATPAPEAAQPSASPPGLKAATAEPQPSEAAPAGVPEAPGPPKDAPAKTGAQGLNFALRVRLGAFSDEGEATQALQRLLARNMSVLNGRAAFVGPAQDGHGFAIELAGFEDAEAAQAACSVLSISDGPCAIAPPASGAARPDRGTVTRTGAKAAKPAKRPGG